MPLSFLVFLSASFLANGLISRSHYYKEMTWNIDEYTFSWPGGSKFSFKKVCLEKTLNSWRYSKEFCLNEFSGTHVDAPRHFNPFGWTVDEIPIKYLILKAVIIDVSKEVVKVGSNFTLGIHHIKRWEEKYGCIDPNSILLIRYGWAKKYNKKSSKYLGIDQFGKFNFPGISTSAAVWIAEHKKFRAIGVDTPSLDPSFSKHFHSRRILAEKQIYAILNIDMRRKFTDNKAVIFVMPLNLRNGLGAPARIFGSFRNKTYFFNIDRHPYE